MFRNGGPERWIASRRELTTMVRARFGLGNAAGRRWAALAAGVVAGVLAAAPADAQEAQTVNAFSVWQGKGAIVQTGAMQVSVTGAFAGPFFFETEEGPIEAGTIACPGIIDIDFSSGHQRGSGACSFTAHDGARAFGVWDCAGLHLIGCRGDFRLTGGTDRLQGISGSGTFLIRSRLHDIAKQPSGITTDNASGISIWRDLKVTMPATAAAK